MGSCFSETIGNKLTEGGINCSVNPMGILFNPISIGNILLRAFNDMPFNAEELYKDQSGKWHALAFESKRQHINPTQLLDELNASFFNFVKSLKNADCLIITFGTAWCFYHNPTSCIVGNCHKLPDKEFERHLCSTEDIVELWSPILNSGKRIIFTISPIRHLNNGLHGNTLSKARLHLAVEQLCDRFPNAEYFPAFEALIDDLRDYRFYNEDLKHPSHLAEEYIFELFSDQYFDRDTDSYIKIKRKESLKEKHRPIF